MLATIANCWVSNARSQYAWDTAFRAFFSLLTPGFTRDAWWHARATLHHIGISLSKAWFLYISRYLVAAGFSSLIFFFHREACISQILDKRRPAVYTISISTRWPKGGKYIYVYYTAFSIWLLFFSCCCFYSPSRPLFFSEFTQSVATLIQSFVGSISSSSFVKRGIWKLRLSLHA